MSDLPKVLLLDDDKSVLGVLREVLRKKLDVTITTDGDEAIRKLRSEGPFQVVLSDMQMEGMNGVEFLRKANEIDPWSTKMLLTGHGDLRTAMAAVNEGRIFRFLTKPCPPTQLVAAFDEAVEHFAKRDQQRRNVIGDKERISRRMVAVQSYAVLGRFVAKMASQLADLSRQHTETLDEAIARAQSGGFVAVDQLHELRAIEEAMRGIVSYARSFGEVDGAAEPVRVADVAERALQNVLRLSDTEIAIERIIVEVPAVEVPPGALLVALSNILENAVEAVAGRPGPRITLEISFDPPTNMVVCDVVDNGPGIHREVRPFILRPFFTTAGLDRAGLGLSVAQSLIESMGGTITFDSTTNDGARFSIELPASTGVDTMSDP